MSALALVKPAVTTCPTCGGPLSLPLRGRGKRSGQVVQTCRAFQVCGQSVWTEAAAVVVAPTVDDGSRHGRFHLPVTSEPEPPVVVAPNRWTPMRRLARRRLEQLNIQDGKLAAAGGDR